MATSLPRHVPAYTSLCKPRPSSAAAPVSVGVPSAISLSGIFHEPLNMEKSSPSPSAMLPDAVSMARASLTPLPLLAVRSVERLDWVRTRACSTSNDCGALGTAR